MSHDYLWRYKREIHFELRKTSFKRSLAFTLQMLPEGIEEWLKADYYGKPYSQETLADVQLRVYT